VALLANKIKKQEVELEEREGTAAAAREQQLREISLLN
jgi:hypothetical protein